MQCMRIVLWQRGRSMARRIKSREAIERTYTTGTKHEMEWPDDWGKDAREKKQIAGSRAGGMKEKHKAMNQKSL